MRVSEYDEEDVEVRLDVAESESESEMLGEMERDSVSDEDGLCDAELVRVVDVDHDAESVSVSS